LAEPGTDGRKAAGGARAKDDRPGSRAKALHRLTAARGTWRRTNTREPTAVGIPRPLMRRGADY